MLGKRFGELKKTLKQGFSAAGIDLTRNMVYDRRTRKIMKNILAPESNCIDVGSHDGDMLYCMVQLSPYGQHYAFEPIPEYYAALKKHFGPPVTVLPYALSDREEKTTFKYVKNAPAYSGLRERKYTTPNPEIQSIDVITQTLDNVVPETLPIDFIKIDVEGAEFKVLTGGKNTIRKWKPVIVFEFGIGASDYYEVTPGHIHHLITGECGLKISTLDGYLARKPALTEKRFAEHYTLQTEYYFIAHP